MGERDQESLGVQEYETLREEAMRLMRTTFDVWRLALGGIGALAAVILLQWSGLREAFGNNVAVAGVEVPLAFPLCLAICFLGRGIVKTGIMAHGERQDAADRIGGYIVIFHESRFAADAVRGRGWHYWNRYEKWSRSHSESSAQQLLLPRVLNRSAMVYSYLWSLSLLMTVVMVLFLATLWLGSTSLAAGQEGLARIGWLIGFLASTVALILSTRREVMRQARQSEGGPRYWSNRWRNVADSASQPNELNRFETEVFGSRISGEPTRELA